MDTDIHLKVTAQNLMFLGFWPMRFKWRVTAFLYKCLYYLTLSIFSLFVFSQFIELYMVMGKSLEELSGLMAINFLYTLGLVKIRVVGGATVQTLIKKIKVTEQRIMEDSDNEIKEMFMSQVAKTYLANKLMIFLGVTCYFMFMLTPPFEELISPPTEYFVVIDNDTANYSPRPLPLVSWFPFDRYKYYYISYFWHCVAATVNTTYIVACNNMFFALMIFAAGQMKILQQYILSLEKPTCNGQNLTSDQIVADNLNKIVVYHNSIIRFVGELDQAMRWFLLLDFAACALQIAVIGFEIIVAEPSLQLLKNVIYISSMVTQLFLYYWLGNEVILESIAISSAVWKSPWYECNHSAKMTLLQLMIRSQKPLRLSVGIFYHMSTETMLVILKSSYTYTTLLRQVYSRKSDI